MRIASVRVTLTLGRAGATGILLVPPPKRPAPVLEAAFVRWRQLRGPRLRRRYRISAPSNRRQRLVDEVGFHRAVHTRNPLIPTVVDDLLRTRVHRNGVLQQPLHERVGRLRLGRLGCVQGITDSVASRVPDRDRDGVQRAHQRGRNDRPKASASNRPADSSQSARAFVIAALGVPDEPASSSARHAADAAKRRPARPVAEPVHQGRLGWGVLASAKDARQRSAGVGVLTRHGPVAGRSALLPHPARFLQPLHLCRRLLHLLEPSAFPLNRAGHDDPLGWLDEPLSTLGRPLARLLALLECSIEPGLHLCPVLGFRHGLWNAGRLLRRNVRVEPLRHGRALLWGTLNLRAQLAGRRNGLRLTAEQLRHRVRPGRWPERLLGCACRGGFRFLCCARRGGGATGVARLEGRADGVTNRVGADIERHARGGVVGNRLEVARGPFVVRHVRQQARRRGVPARHGLHTGQGSRGTDASKRTQGAARRDERRRIHAQFGDKRPGRVPAGRAADHGTVGLNHCALHISSSTQLGGELVGNKTHGVADVHQTASHRVAKSRQGGWDVSKRLQGGARHGLHRVPSKAVRSHVLVHEASHAGLVFYLRGGFLGRPPATPKLLPPRGLVELRPAPRVRRGHYGLLVGANGLSAEKLG